MNLTSISTIKNLMAKHNMAFSKSLGQNFLVNPTVCPKMVELSEIDSTIGVIEIGPGIGVLTRELAQRAKKVVAIELDNRLRPILGETLADLGNVKLIFGDVLKQDLASIIAENFAGLEVAVCANLPYYITSPIIMKLLEEDLPIKSITALIQKEVAQRIAAPVPSREVGAITISVAYYSTPKVLFSVSAGSFLPAPKVESSAVMLEIIPRDKRAQVDKQVLSLVVKSAFGQRRKTISNSLSAGFAVSKEEINSLLKSAGVAHSLRPEQLTMDQFYAVANALSLL